ncbi:MAG: tetratricopeptide repeat protein [Candidatus Aminicenantes bacterium]
MLVFAKVDDLSGQGDIYLIKGIIYLEIGENSKALEMYDKAIKFFKIAADIQSESTALHGKAKVLAKLEKNDEAMGLFEKAIAKLEKVRT